MPAMSVGGTIGDRENGGLIEFYEGRIGERDLALGRDVAGDAVRLRELHDERLPVARRFEVDVRRIHGDGLGDGLTAQRAENAQ